VQLGTFDRDEHDPTVAVRRRAVFLLFDIPVVVFRFYELLPGRSPRPRQSPGLSKRIPGRRHAPTTRDGWQGGGCEIVAVVVDDAYRLVDEASERREPEADDRMLSFFSMGMRVGLIFLLRAAVPLNFFRV
jgi:hypothetical protein